MRTENHTAADSPNSPAFPGIPTQHNPQSERQAYRYAVYFGHCGTLQAVHYLGTCEPTISEIVARSVELGSRRVVLAYLRTEENEAMKSDAPLWIIANMMGIHLEKYSEIGCELYDQIIN